MNSEQQQEQQPEPPRGDIHALLLNLSDQLKDIGTRLTAVETRFDDDMQSRRRDDPPSSPSSSSSSSSSASSSPPAHPVRRNNVIHIEKETKYDPPEFSGDIAQYKTFWSKCRLAIQLNPTKYASPESRVLLVASKLTGDAYKYVEDIVDNTSHPLRKDFDAFKEMLDNVYTDRNYRDDCMYQLQNLRQKGSVATYSVKFKSLVAPLGYNESAKIDRFMSGLNTELRKSIRVQGPSKTLEKLIDQAIRIDAAQYQAKKEATDSNVRPSTSLKPAESSASSSQSSKRPAPPSNDSSTPAKKPKTFAFSTPKVLTDAEKQYRRDNNLCAYCGSASHKYDSCPSVAAKDAKSSSRSSTKPSPSKVPSFVKNPPVINAVILGPDRKPGKDHARVPTRS